MIGFWLALLLTFPSPFRIQSDDGMGIDPNGRHAVRARHRCTIDPNGAPCTPAAALDRGAGLDPNGAN
jgi:hypothetical protein